MKEGWTKDIIDHFVKQEPSLRPLNRNFSDMKGRLGELVRQRQSEDGTWVYESMRVYFEEMVAFVESSRGYGVLTYTEECWLNLQRSAILLLI